MLPARAGLADGIGCLPSESPESDTSREMAAILNETDGGSESRDGSPERNRILNSASPVRRSPVRGRGAVAPINPEDGYPRRLASRIAPTPMQSTPGDITGLSGLADQPSHLDMSAVSPPPAYMAEDERRWRDEQSRPWNAYSANSSAGAYVGGRPMVPRIANMDRARPALSEDSMGRYQATDASDSYRGPVAPEWRPPNPLMEPHPHGSYRARYDDRPQQHEAAERAHSLPHFQTSHSLQDRAGTATPVARLPAPGRISNVYSHGRTSVFNTCAPGEDDEALGGMEPRLDFGAQGRAASAGGPQYPPQHGGRIPAGAAPPMVPAEPASWRGGGAMYGLAGGTVPDLLADAEAVVRENPPRGPPLPPPVHPPAESLDAANMRTEGSMGIATRPGGSEGAMPHGAATGPAGHASEGAMGAMPHGGAAAPPMRSQGQMPMAGAAMEGQIPMRSTFAAGNRAFSQDSQGFGLQSEGVMPPPAARWPSVGAEARLGAASAGLHPGFGPPLAPLSQGMMAPRNHQGGLNPVDALGQSFGGAFAGGQFAGGIHQMGGPFAGGPFAGSFAGPQPPMRSEGAMPPPPGPYGPGAWGHPADSAYAPWAHPAGPHGHPGYVGHPAYPPAAGHGPRYDAYPAGHPGYGPHPGYAPGPAGYAPPPAHAAYPPANTAAPGQVPPAGHGPPPADHVPAPAHAAAPAGHEAPPAHTAAPAHVPPAGHGADARDHQPGLVGATSSGHAAARADSPPAHDAPGDQIPPDHEHPGEYFSAGQDQAPRVNVPARAGHAKDATTGARPLPSPGRLGTGSARGSRGRSGSAPGPGLTPAGGQRASGSQRGLPAGRPTPAVDLLRGAVAGVASMFRGSAAVGSHADEFPPFQEDAPHDSAAGLRDYAPPTPQSPLGALPREMPLSPFAARNAEAARARRNMVEVAQQTTPDKCQIVPRTRKRQRDIGSTLVKNKKLPFNLIEVPLENVSASETTATSRHRIRTLEFWRGEKQEWERLPGSVQPTPKSVIIAQDVVPAMPRKRDLIPLSPGIEGAIVLSPQAAEGEVTPPPLRRQTGQRNAARAGAGRGSGRAGRGRGRVEASRSPRRSSSLADVTVPDLVVPAEEGMLSCEEREEIEVAAVPPPRRMVAAAGGKGKICECGEKCGKAAICKRCGRNREDAEAPQPPNDGEEGFVDALIAEGSLHPCKVRIGKNTPFWLCCDILVPPSSFNAPEQLGDGRSLMISVLNDARGALKANINEQVLDLRQGDHFVVKSGSEYSLRNDSDTIQGSVKMVMMIPAEAAA